MRTSQAYLAWLCAVLFVVTGVAAFLLFNIERRAFSAETFKQAFEQQNLYARMPAILADAIYTSITQDGNADPFLKTLTVTDLEAGITDLLPPEELKVLSNGTLDLIFGYLNNQANSVSIPLLSIKSRLAGPQGVELVRRIINAQPECTAEQLLQMGMGFFSGDIALCNPPEEMMGLVTPLIESEMRLLASAVPDEVTLISVANNSATADPRIRLNRVRTAMKLSPLLPALFLVALTVLVVRNLTDWLKWWGYSLLVMGMISVLITLIGSPLLGLVIRGVIQSQAGFLPPILISVLGETVSTVSGQILSPVVIGGMLLGTVGFGMGITSLFLRKK